MINIIHILIYSIVYIGKDEQYSVGHYPNTAALFNPPNFVNFF